MQLSSGAGKAPDDGRGPRAARPAEIPRRGWGHVLWRLGQGFFADALGMVARSIAFSWVVALFPGLAAFVSLYGLFSDPQHARAHLSLLSGVVPADALTLIGDEMVRIASEQQASLSLTFAVSLALALVSANTGMRALIRGLNIAYVERERRSLLRLHLTSFALTIGGFAFALAAAAALVVAPAVLRFIGAPAGILALAWLRWPLLLAVALLALSVLYRFAPDRRRARWRWISWGSGIAALLWLGSSALFSWFVEAFSGFSATYGSLGALFGFLIWSWLSAQVVLLGAKLNAEKERQTAADSTVPPDKPMGARGATVADTLGRSRPASRLRLGPWARPLAGLRRR